MKSCARRVLTLATFMLILLTASMAADQARKDDPVAGVGGTTLYFPFVNNGDDLLTTFTLINRTPAATTGTISFFDDQGLPMPLVINGQPPRTSIDFSLPPHGRVDYATNAMGELQTGSARVTSLSAVGGTMAFGHSNFCPAGTGPSTPVLAFATPARNQGGTVTLTAITAIDPVPTLLRIDLYNTDGTLARTANTSIGANGRIAQFLNTIFPGIDNFQGSMVVTATGGRVAAVAIDLNISTMMFVMLPITPVLLPL